MTANKQVYLLDAGNTQIKIALAQNGVIQGVERFNHSHFSFEKLARNIPIACSSVIDENLLLAIRTHFTNVFEITSLINLPFHMGYESPQTLGIDRLCNVAALSKMHAKQARLAIDLGTCIKFDFLDANNVYRGGSISPGLQMRAKALAHFTAKLPEIEAKVNTNFIGANTTQSLQIGVYLGWQKEIEGLLATYQAAFPELVTYISGGDGQYFDLGQKNGIFVHENLTLEGILELYLAND